MGIDYESINRCEQFEYDTFIPNFFSSGKKTINEKINKKSETKNNEYSELSKDIILGNT